MFLRRPSSSMSSNTISTSGCARRSGIFSVGGVIVEDAGVAELGKLESFEVLEQLEEFEELMDGESLSTDSPVPSGIPALSSITDSMIEDEYSVLSTYVIAEDGLKVCEEGKAYLKRTWRRADVKQETLEFCEV